MTQGNDLEEIKERLTNIEEQLKHRPNTSNGSKAVIIFVIVILILSLISIGIYQFAVAS